MLDLPLVAQELDFTCGAACFESMFRYLRGISLGERHFAWEMGTLELGYTPPERVVSLALAYGFECSMKTDANLGDLHAALTTGWVIFITWWDEDAGHYSLLRSMNESEVVLMDPWTAREGHDTHLPIAEFERHWKARGARMITVR